MTRKKESLFRNREPDSLLRKSEQGQSTLPGCCCNCSDLKVDFGRRVRRRPMCRRMWFEKNTRHYFFAHTVFDLRTEKSVVLGEKAGGVIVSDN